MEFFNSLKKVDLEKLKTKYKNAKPFPYVVIDDFLPYEIVSKLEGECRETSTNVNVSDNFQQIKKNCL